MESFILAVSVALFVWLFMRRRRMKQKQMQEQQAARDAGPPQEPQSMPRVGKSGSVTKEQMKALKDNNFEPARHWSKEEAQLILDALGYLRAVVAAETGEKKAPLDIQNKMLAFILGDEILREFLLDRARNLTREELERNRIEPERDEHYARVAKFVNELWDAG
jgi:hypothetical protein